MRRVRHACVLLLPALAGCVTTSEPAPLPPVVVRAIRADLQLDDGQTRSEDVAELYARACERGWEPGCEPPASPDRTERLRALHAALLPVYPDAADWLSVHDIDRELGRSEAIAAHRKRSEDMGLLCHRGFLPACVSDQYVDRRIPTHVRFNRGLDACHAGFPQGCDVAGQLAIRSDLFCDDSPCAGGDAIGVPLLRLACDRGEWSACGRLAYALDRPNHWQSGTLVEPILERACANAHPYSCGKLAQLYDEHRVRVCIPAETCTAADREATTLYTRACELDHAWACHKLARRHATGNTDLCGHSGEPCAEGQLQSYTLIAQTCDMEDGSACLTAGRIAQRGESGHCTPHGEPCDDGLDTAREHFITGCRLGNDRACVRGARLIRTQAGSTSDWPEHDRYIHARALLDPACFVHEHESACRALARHYGTPVGDTTVVTGPMGTEHLICADGTCSLECPDPTQSWCSDLQPFEQP